MECFIICLVIILRVFYIFNLNKEVYDVYKETPSVLFNFFKNLYYMKKEELEYGKSIFNQVALNFNKEKLDLKIYIMLHNKLKYLKRKEEHIINDLYHDEISIMKVKKTYIIINCNKNFTDFFNILNKEYSNCIVCDFINDDYFYLSNIKMLV